MKLFVVVALVFSSVAAYADKTDKFIEQEMKVRNIPGLALTIIQNGKRTKTETYGYANLELKVPVSRDTAFEIGSVTKQFTAAGIMKLVQQGKLSTSDKISKHLKGTPSAWSEITVRHLLTHTSGIKSYTGLDGYALSLHLTQDQFIEKIGALPLEFQPGAKWSYCNTAYNLLGFIIENLSGKGYWEFMGENIFGPAGMVNTTNREPSIIIPNRASGYEKDKNGRLINRDYDVTDIFSAGAIVSTLGDLSKWDAALETNDILTSDSKREMWTATKLNDGSTKNYGYAWYVDTLEGHKNIGHSGSTSGFSASFQRFPDDHLTVIVLCNSGDSGVATVIAKAIAKFYFPPPVAQK